MTNTNEPYHILLPVKFFRKKEHADAFRAGVLHAKRLKYFREMEDDPHRGDKHEGSILLEGTTLEVKADDDEGWVTIPTAGPVRFNYGYLDNLNLFCMTVFQSLVGTDAQEMFADVLCKVRESLSTCIEMGKHAVIIGNFREFIERVENAAKNADYECWCRSVNYYDSYPRDVILLNLSETPSVRPAFLKRRIYEQQHEFRIVLNTATEGDNPRELDIGNIRNISACVETESLATLKCYPHEVHMNTTP